MGTWTQTSPNVGPPGEGFRVCGEEGLHQLLALVGHMAGRNGSGVQ